MCKNFPRRVLALDLGQQSLCIVCVENLNCNYLLRGDSYGLAFVSILFSNILFDEERMNYEGLIGPGPQCSDGHLAARIIR